MTPTASTLPDDDLGRTATIVHADDPGLVHLGVGAGTYTTLISGQDTGGRYALIDMYVPTGGPPPHRHDFEEMFYILEGELDVTFRGEVHRVGPGQSVNVPANAPHFFRVASAGPARMLCLCLPAGQEEFFELVSEKVPSRTSPPAQLSQEEAVARRTFAGSLAERFRTEFLPPPAQG